MHIRSKLLFINVLLTYQRISEVIIDVSLYLFWSLYIYFGLFISILVSLYLFWSLYIYFGLFISILATWMEDVSGWGPFKSYIMQWGRGVRESNSLKKVTKVYGSMLQALRGGEWVSIFQKKVLCNTW